MNIELSNVCKSYFNKDAKLEQEVLKGITINIKQGEAIAIIGPSGSGKSTLLNLLGTLDQTTSGSISYDGKELKDFKDQQLALFRNQKIGFVFQSHHLLPQLNVLENILLPSIAYGDKKSRQEAEDRARKWLEEVGLSDKVAQFPSNLSGGECQRVAVIRALINQPDLILADEPTGSLDSESAEIVGDLLLRLTKEQNVALVLVTHSIAIAEKFGEVYELKGGVLNGLQFRSS
ncbi:MULTISPECIES: ABC transporter ATP-binding protein [unclassified Lentimicrobium]|uniref:ABC transporter ATP-binding protein n=1 Tax=unclassified Lentimicrobium TaxID=2677434 RepID=UPI0015563F71|nr:MULTISPECIES: ABC transporter ATP-binding protein [unclassified Lentimicrobium]NPD45852.1 ABC transporter ATP-binding protein [Lentimicrobium sp. S6]NPD86561.1 ABC transporter ATP-binding protein [Lentimicrobium sp. L6]